ncbi:MAG: peptidylprolyl isomerase [Sulfuricaulis sp.]|nr:peptidylprolyl isomerase [Sulfuricaulis sp.]
MTIVRAISQIVFYCRRYRHYQAYLRLAACAVLAALFFSPQLAAATTVRMETTLGGIDIELYDNQTPITVANFLTYAARGDYTNNGFIHRSVPGFILQGGGYLYGNSPLGIFVTRIPVLDPPIQNEFSASRSNVRSTIAMAKLPGDPNSATSEWFFNLADNSANLDYQNGGFTVFGHVLTGMNVVDAIANLPVWNATSVNGALDNLPLINFDPAIGLQPNNFVQVTGIFKVAFTNTMFGALVRFTADLDMVFNSVGTVDTATVVSRLGSFTSPPNQSVYFNNGMFTLMTSGVMGVSGRVVTLYDGATNRPTRYYAYGKTQDNQTDHWYDFTYDGETGAEIKNNRIILHFVDGKRGDDDLDPTNNSITHTGAQAVVTENASSSSQAGGGCSVATTTSGTPRGGDWIVVSLFLTFVALVRRRTRNGRIQRAPR